MPEIDPLNDSPDDGAAISDDPYHRAYCADPYCWCREGDDDDYPD